MSLIVARVAANGLICIVADTAITYRTNSNKVPLTEGCLKQYRLGQTIAVAFAGSVESFSRLWGEIRDLRVTAEIVRLAVEHSSATPDLELLVAEAGEDTITFIKGGIPSASGAGFLGDALAYSAFQELFHNPRAEPAPEDTRGRFEMQRLPEPHSPCELYSRMFEAMKAIIIDPSFASVGGILIPLCTDKGEFRYMNYVESLSDQIRVDEFSDEPRTLQFGTAEGGAYSIDFSDDRPLGGAGDGVGLFVLQGGFGVVFGTSPGGIRTAQVIRAANPALWCLESSLVLGHGIASSFASIDHAGQAGEHLITEERFADAAYCYELRKDSAEIENRPAVAERYFVGYAIALALSGRENQAVVVLERRLQSRGLSDASKQLLQDIKHQH